MNKLAIFTTLFFTLTIFSQTPKKELSPEQKKIKTQQYIEYLKKQNRKRDSIYKRKEFSEYASERKKEQVLNDSLPTEIKNESANPKTDLQIFKRTFNLN